MTMLWNVAAERLSRSALAGSQDSVFDRTVGTEAVLNHEGDRTMCFAEPGRVSSIDGTMVRVVTSDGPVEASLRLVEAEGRSVVVGDWVLVSLGLVVSIVDEATGQILFNEMTSLRQGLER